MGRNTADAICKICNKAFTWLIGTPMICVVCLQKEESLTKQEEKEKI